MAKRDPLSGLRTASIILLMGLATCLCACATKSVESPVDDGRFPASAEPVEETQPTEPLAPAPAPMPLPEPEPAPSPPEFVEDSAEKALADAAGDEADEEEEARLPESGPLMEPLPLIEQSVPDDVADMDEVRPPQEIPPAAHSEASQGRIRLLGSKLDGFKDFIESFVQHIPAEDFVVAVGPKDLKANDTPGYVVLTVKSKMLAALPQRVESKFSKYDVKVKTFMTADFKGDPNGKFTQKTLPLGVEFDGRDPQWITPSRELRWKWKVRSAESEEFPFKIELKMLMELNGESDFIVVRNFDGTVPFKYDLWFSLAALIESLGVRGWLIGLMFAGITELFRRLWKKFGPRHAEGTS